MIQRNVVFKSVGRVLFCSSTSFRDTPHLREPNLLVHTGSGDRVQRLCPPSAVGSVPENEFSVIQLYSSESQIPQGKGNVDLLTARGGTEVFNRVVSVIRVVEYQASINTWCILRRDIQ